MGGERPTAESPWAPLSHPVFRALWIASLASNIGTWMQHVGAARAMTSLSPSPLMVALVQSATSLPVFVVGLPASTVADIVDRRQLLLVTQTWMLAAAVLLAVLAFADLMTATTLLALTFALGIGVAMNTSTWQAITAELVPPSELTRAVALNALPVNIGRAIGPAMGGGRAGARLRVQHPVIRRGSRRRVSVASFLENAKASHTRRDMRCRSALLNRST
jgi:MFS family permease